MDKIVQKKIEFLNLISECEDDIKEEYDSIDNGNWALGDTERLSIVVNKTNDLGCWGIIPVLEDQDTGSNEHGTSQQWEEQVNSFVDWCAHHVTLKRKRTSQLRFIEILEVNQQLTSKQTN